MNKTSQILLHLAMVCHVGLAWGDTGNGGTTPALPTAQALSAEMQRIERERRTLFDAATPALPTARPTLPPAHPPGPGARASDPGTLAERFAGTAAPVPHDALLIFVSFSMPPASLQRLMASAAQVGAMVMLRGLKNNSLKDTRAAIAALGVPASGVQIHPQAFTQYRIRQVPTIVLLKTDGSGTLDSDGCALPDDFIGLAGDVALDYALETIAQRAPAYAGPASRYRRQLRGPE